MGFLSLLFKVFVRADVMGCAYKNEARMISTVITWRKTFSDYSCYLVFFFVLGVMSYFVNSRFWNFLSGFVVCHVISVS